MAKCNFSLNRLCQVKVLKGTVTKVTCDGHHAACLPSRGLNIEDIRFPKDKLPAKSQDCPDPLCILDIPDSTVCQSCPNKPKPHPAWGGKRAGAGAPRANLNRLVHGRNSKLLKVAVEKLSQDPELRAFLLLLARATTEGELPQSTKQLITRSLGGVKQ